MDEEKKEEKIVLYNGRIYTVIKKNKKKELFIVKGFLKKKEKILDSQIDWEKTYRYRELGII